MTSARFGKWADADEDSEEDVASPTAGDRNAPIFETRADEQGIRMVIDYKERDGKTYKITKRLRQTKITSWTNEKIVMRKDMRKFGKPTIADPTTEKNLC